MRLLVLYASDLADPSRIAPGGITSNIRGYVGGLPADWDIEVWGASEQPRWNTHVTLGERSVRFRSIVRAEPVLARGRALNPRYAAALACQSWRERLSKRFDAVISHRSEYLAALTLSQGRRRLPPVVQMIHGSSAWSGRSFSRLAERFFLVGERLAVSSAAAIALVAESTLQYYRERYPASADRFSCIPNGVDLSRWPPSARSSRRAEWRARLHLADQDRVLVYHGRFAPEKGIERLLAVLAILRRDGAPWTLAVAGSGPLGATIASAAQATGTAIRMAGPLKSTDVAGFLCAGDLGLLCSDFEGLSNGLLESLAAGLPVVATPVGDTAIVLSEVDPKLTPGTSPEALAGAVRHAWAVRRELSARARLRAEDYSVAKRSGRIADLVHSVCSQEGSRQSDAI